MQLPAKQTRAAAQLATQFPAEKLTRVAAQGLSVSFHIGLHGGAYVRTGGQSVGRSDVITKPNFVALMGLPKSLINGAPRARSSTKKYQILFIYNNYIVLFSSQVENNYRG